MKYYKIEKNNNQKICCIFGIIILIIGLISNTKLPATWDMRENLFIIGSPGWFFSLFPIIVASAFVFWCGILFGKQATNFQKWHSYLRKYGIKCRGQVKKVLIHQNVENTHCSYSFVISYYSLIKNEKIEFETPILSVYVSDNIRVYCDVYEIEQKPLWGEENDSISCHRKLKREENDFRPFYLIRAVNKQSNQKWFGNVVADNFEGLEKKKLFINAKETLKIILTIAILIAAYMLMIRCFK